jgi:hypothetical protein
MNKNLILIVFTMIIVALVSISCEKDFDDISNPKVPEDSTIVVINPIDTITIDTTPVITIVPKVFVPARKLSIGNSFALVGYSKSMFKSANDIIDETGSADGLFQLIYDNAGNPIADTVYTLGENDSISVGNEIYVSDILDLNNGHVLLKGSFKFVLDTLGNTKSKHDLIVRKSDGYIVNYDDNDQEYIIDKQFKNEKVRNLSNGDVLYSSFDNTSFTIDKLEIGSENINTESVVNDYTWYFSTDNNNNVVYYEEYTYNLKIKHANGLIELVGNRQDAVNDTLRYWDFYTNDLNEIYLIAFTGNINMHYYIYKINIASNSYSLELVNNFNAEQNLANVSFQNNGGSNLVYNLSKGDATTFVTYDESNIVWVNAHNNAWEKRVLFNLTTISEKIITVNSDDFVYMTINNSVLKISISTGNKTNDYFHNSDYTITSISTTSDDYLTIASVRNSDNANVVWSVSPSGSAEIVSEVLVNVVSAVENIE